MGKTAFMLSLALDMALGSIPVAIFSLELSEKQLIKRLLCNICSLPLNEIGMHLLLVNLYTSFFHPDCYSITK